MPFFAFRLSRPEQEEELPRYSRVSQLPTYITGVAHNKQLSTIPELDEEGDEAICDDGSSKSWIYRVCSYSSMLPQALLVDASSTLCAYLYFTSLQARLVLQQQSALDIVSDLCSGLPTNVDRSALQHCTQAIANVQDLNAPSLPFSHHAIIIFTMLKALSALLLLTRCSAFIKPFDYLVASGAVHCLAIYACYFVPIATVLQGHNADKVGIMTHVAAQFAWIFLLCAALGLAHFTLSALTRSDEPAIALPLTDDTLTIVVTEEKDDAQLV